MTGSLCEIIADVSIRDPRTQQEGFLPNNERDKLVTESSIKAELELRCPDNSSITTDVFQSAPRLFAILVRVDAVEYLPAFIKAGIRDINLPLEWCQDSSGSMKWLRCKRESPPVREESELEIEFIKDWVVPLRNNFFARQWSMFAPVFRNQYEEFPANYKLPFIFDGRGVGALPGYDIKEGGFAKVWGAKIHFAHEKLFSEPTLEGREPFVAVKNLTQPPERPSKKLLKKSWEEAFRKEINMLWELGRKKHPHLVTLLAAYKFGKQCCMLFPWARGNLREFWEELEPNPTHQPATVQWYLEQMLGIASALDLIHEFERDPFTVIEESERNPALPPVEKRYGIHGDIKPENILLYENPEDNCHKGILKISDFGLARFHSQHTRSGISPSRAVASPDYEPPEMRLKKKISRTYDMWSIGCIYLEFTIWLLTGSDGLKEFEDARFQPVKRNISDDSFYSIRSVKHKDIAEPRKAVVDWIKKMHAHEKCSEAIHDVLEIISQDLLQPKSEHRTGSKELKGKLEAINCKAMDYLFKPCPRSFSNRYIPSCSTGFCFKIR